MWNSPIVHTNHKHRHNIPIVNQIKIKNRQDYCDDPPSRFCRYDLAWAGEIEDEQLREEILLKVSNK